ncbi:uncharacterized protein EAF01_008107 [Botrytis porri]|uniref:uncharacterized protein n=1 Tax=Botrytis porri TaxID=87229 RepID=UPI001901357A|nr:uncharacterized protein EAF01_008107 [Botrytis porri]KAF7898894.1 hypothetical protein EAF01_008107 [Botrytis porri]
MLISGTVDVNDDGSQKSEKVDLGAPYAVVGDKYAEFIRSGAIKQGFGRITQLRQCVSHSRRFSIKQYLTHDTNSMLATIEMQCKPIKIEEIAAVVYATGFSTSPALNFLPEGIKESLGYNASYACLPLLLSEDCMSSSRDSPSNLALMGCFAGSYWGVLDSRARVITRKWGEQSIELSSPDFSHDETEEEDSSKFCAFMEELRITMDRSLIHPPNDYPELPELTEENSRKLGLQKINLSWDEREGMVSPAHYIDSQCNITESEKAMHKLQKTLQDSRDGKAVFAKSTFHGL